MGHVPLGPPPPAAVHEAARMLAGGTDVCRCCTWRARPSRGGASTTATRHSFRGGIVKASLSRQSRGPRTSRGRCRRRPNCRQEGAAPGGRGLEGRRGGEGGGGPPPRRQMRTLAVSTATGPRQRRHRHRHWRRRRHQRWRRRHQRLPEALRGCQRRRQCGSATSGNCSAHHINV